MKKGKDETLEKAGATKGCNPEVEESGNGSTITANDAVESETGEEKNGTHLLTEEDAAEDGNAVEDGVEAETEEREVKAKEREVDAKEREVDADVSAVGAKDKMVDAEEIERMIAEAEARGYERGRNEQIETWLNEGRSKIPSMSTSKEPESEIMILNNMRKSVWD